MACSYLNNYLNTDSEPLDLVRDVLQEVFSPLRGSLVIDSSLADRMYGWKPTPLISYGELTKIRSQNEFGLLDVAFMTWYQHAHHNYTLAYLQEFCMCLREESKYAARPKLQQVASLIEKAIAEHQQSTPPVPIAEHPQQQDRGTPIENVLFFYPYFTELAPHYITLSKVLGLSSTYTPAAEGVLDEQGECFHFLTVWLAFTRFPTVEKFCKCLEQAWCFKHVRHSIMTKYGIDQVSGSDLSNEGEDEGEAELEDPVDQETRKVIQNALKKGAVQIQVVKCVILGPPQVGKSQLKRALLEDFDEVLESTNASTQATPAVEIFVAGNKKWEAFDHRHLKALAKTDFIDKSSHLPVGPGIPNEAPASPSSTDFRGSQVQALEDLFRKQNDLVSEQIEKAKPETNDLSEFKLMYIIDNGGQPSFLDFHSVTAIFPASYILVYNASKGLDAFPEMTFRKTTYEKKIRPNLPPSIFSNHDLLKRYLLTVHHLRGRFARRCTEMQAALKYLQFKPPSASYTLVVGTHKDVTNDHIPDEQRLKDLYQNIPSLEHRVRIHCVDSRKQECKALEQVRSSIAHKDNLCQFRLPLSWFKFYQMSLRSVEQDCRVQRYCDLEKVCQGQEYVKSPEEFRAMVSVMHCLGMFFCPDLDLLEFSPEADLSNVLVFLDPNLLFKYLSDILIIPFLDLSEESACLRKLQACGELDKVECLAELNIPDSLTNLPGFHGKLLEWLVNWGLAAKKDGEDRWFIPSVLPLRPKAVTSTPASGGFSCFPLYLTFIQETSSSCTFHYLPAGFFPLFVVQLLKMGCFVLPDNSRSGVSDCFPRCRDSILLNDKIDNEHKLNIDLVDEVDRLAVHISPALEQSSNCFTLEHAGAVLADLKVCMNQTNVERLACTDSIALCSSCCCCKTPPKSPSTPSSSGCSVKGTHLAKIVESGKWLCKCLHAQTPHARLMSVDSSSPLATVLAGYYRNTAEAAGPVGQQQIQQQHPQQYQTQQQHPPQPKRPCLTNLMPYQPQPELQHTELRARSIISIGDLIPYLDSLLPALGLLGPALGISDYAEAIIHQSGSPDDQCTKILQKWLRCNSQPNWILLCEKLSKVDSYTALVARIKEDIAF